MNSCGNNHYLRKYQATAFLGVLFSLALFTRANAETYYVSNSGNDSWPGTSPDSAFATLQHSADICSPGDSILALNGSYAGFDLRSGGSESEPVVFSTTGGGAWIDRENPVTNDGINLEGADWVVIDGFNLTGLARNGIRVVLSDHVTVRNCFCENCYERGIFTGFAEWITIEYNECLGSIDEHGIYHSNSGDHPVIRYNICHHNNACGIHMNGDQSSGGDGIISDAEVYGNLVYENGNAGGSGINCDGVVESRIFNNLLYMNHSSGISLYRIDGSTGSHHVEVYNNIVVQPDDGRWAININTGSTHATLLNNILLSDHSYRGSICLEPSSMEGFQSDYNLLENRLSTDGGNTVITLAQWQALGYGNASQVCSSWANTFTDWVNGNFHHVQGSQSLDSGTSAVQAVVTHDIEGVPRPQGSGYDLGCYEDYPEGISETETSIFSVEIIRNPGSYTFSGIPSDAHVGVFNMAGRCMATLEPASGTSVWNTAGSYRGIYLFSVTDSDQRILTSGKLLNL
ncbi:MAG: right-handed parallel beta-helix repeat-containing protein [Candidatus Neomarinimicrobiota bacterium]